MTKTVILGLLLLGSFVEQSPTSPSADVFSKIREEGTSRSQVSPVFEMFTVTIGPRLTASPAHNRRRNGRAIGSRRTGLRTSTSSRGRSDPAGWCA